MKSISFLILPVILLFTHCSKEKASAELPILGSRTVKESKVNGKIVEDTIYHTIPDFKFLDQDSSWVSQTTFKDKIYVADFFFTTCPTICPIMKTQMLRVYNKFIDNDKVLFLSHSIDPEHDTVAVLREFANRLGVDSKKWHFITGKKEDIYDIGQKSYMVTALEDKTEPGGFIHSGAFLLIDKERRIRGIYDGTKEDEVDRLMEDIVKLLKEEFK